MADKEIDDQYDFFREVVLDENGALKVSGGAGDVNHGFIDYNDSSTGAAPVSITADTWTDIPNDKAGAFTNEGYAPQGVTSLMDGSTGYLDFFAINIR